MSRNMQVAGAPKYKGAKIPDAAFQAKHADKGHHNKAMAMVSTRLVGLIHKK